MSFFNRGSNDKAQNKGQVDPSKFDNAKDRKDYQAGHNRQQEKQQRERDQKK